LPALGEDTGGVEGLLVDGELLVRQLASPLIGGGEVVRRFVVGVVLADEVVLNGAVYTRVIQCTYHKWGKFCWAKLLRF